MHWCPIPLVFHKELPPRNKSTHLWLLLLLCLSIHLDPSGGIPCPDPVDVLTPSRTTSKATPEGPPHSKWQGTLPLHKALSQNHQEAFNWDSSLGKEAREEYFKRHSLNFNDKNTHNFTGIFRCMIETTGLLDSGIPLWIPKGNGADGHTWSGHTLPL